MSCATDHMRELTYPDRLAMHDLNYLTRVEQQGKTTAQLNAQWYDRGYWSSIPRQVDHLDELISDFNRRTGVPE